MNKKLLALALAIVMIFGCTFPVVALSNEDYFSTDVSSMTDEEFFGVWNNGTESWVGSGKLNYEYTDELSPVEDCVKNADYDGAKEALLTYLRTRSGGYEPPLPTADYPTDLLIDGVFTNRLEIIEKELSVGTDYEWLEADVTSLLKSVKNSLFSICLHARKKEAESIRIASRESEYAPYVEAVVDGKTVSLPVIKDLYIRAEAYENENFGVEDEILVRDSGNPIDSDTRIGFIEVDTSSLSTNSVITSAKLKLYAKTDAAEPSKLMLFRFFTKLDEETDTFKTLKSSLGIVSWQGIECGSDWEWPEGYYSEFGYHFNRFYFLAKLVELYRQTGNEYYAYHTINFILDFIKDKYVSYPRVLEEAIRAEQWYTIFWGVLNSEWMTPQACSAIMKYFWQSANEQMTGFAVGSNWGTTQTQTLVGFCAVFPEFRDQPLWLKTARNRLENDISPLILDDGAYIENSTSYAAVTLNALLSILTYAENAGLKFSSKFINKVELFINHIMDTSDPNGVPVEWGDGKASNVRNTILKLGELFENQEQIYFGSNGENGAVPKRTSALYPIGRRAFMRNSWDKDATYLFINNYKGNIHGHSDSLHIYLHAYGEPLLVDTGKSSYDLENDEIAIWQTFDTEAHNSIDINDKSQENIDRKETALMDMTEYTDFYTGYSDSVSDARFTRNILFIKPRWFIVSDLLEPKNINSVNEYKQTWHLPYRANPSIDETTKIGRSNFDKKANILVIPADPDELEATLPTGWGRGDKGSADEQKYLKYTQKKSGNVTYDTVLLPQKMGANDNIDISRVDTGFDKSEVSALKITLNDNVFEYIIAHSHIDDLKTYGTNSYDGRMAFYERDSYGKLKMVSISDGKNLTVDGTEIIKSSRKIKNLSLEYSHKDMYLSTTDENFSAYVYVPEETENIYLNNILATIQKNGTYALIGGGSILPEGEKDTQDGVVKVTHNKAEYDKYLSVNDEAVKIYTLEIQQDTVAEGGVDYDGAIALPFIRDEKVLIKPDYTVSFSKSVKITNYFNNGEDCFYTTPRGIEEKIPECSLEQVEDMLKNTAVVKVGNDFYTIYNLQYYSAPIAEETITSPLEPPISPSEPENSQGMSDNTSSGNAGNGGGGSGGAAGKDDKDDDKELGETSTSFMDTKGHWAENEIKALTEKGILKGISEELFMPDKTVTRAEFVTMLIRALGDEVVKYEACFKDVYAPDWYADVLQTAYSIGLMEGFEGYVRPNDNITREEMIKIIVSAYSTYFDEKTSSAAKIKFTDNDSISRWAYSYVEQAAEAGIVQGDTQGNFNPRDSATRAQAAVILQRILAKNNE